MMDFQIRKQRREEMVREVGQDRLAKRCGTPQAMRRGLKRAD